MENKPEPLYAEPTIFRKLVDSRSADVLTAIERLEEALSGCVRPGEGGSAAKIALPGLARAIHRARGNADELILLDGFAASPGFDHLLDLYIQESEGKQVSITSACIGMRCPLTTALRWIQAMEQRGLVQRESDARDKRRSYVRLTSEGTDKIQKAVQSYFA